MKNIYLIGMPGSGKSTVAKILSDRLKAELIDTDAVIETLCEKSINEIFAQNGEPYFREIETKVLSDISKKDNAVVSTGGGVVTRQENTAILKGGTVVFIDTPIEAIKKRGDFSDRPLLRNNIDNLTKLYRERYDIYKSCADIVVLGDDEANNIASTIISFLKG